MLTIFGVILYVIVFNVALVYDIYKKNKIQKRIDAVNATKGIWKYKK